MNNLDNMNSEPYIYPLISIIIPNLNGKTDTINLLESIQCLDYPKERLEVIIVDVNSKDGSVAAIKEKFVGMAREQFLNLKIIEETVDKGAPYSYNDGIKNANSSYNYILKLDNDVILEKNSLKELLDVAETDKSVGIVGAKCYYYNNKNEIWQRGFNYNLWFGKISRLEDIEKYDKQTEVDFIPGCCMLVKKAVITDVGLLYEKYFLYYDDTDLCYRTMKHGFKVVYCPKATVWHKVSATASRIKGKPLYYMTRNKLIFLKRNASIVQFTTAVLSFLFTEFLYSNTLIVLKNKDIKLLIIYYKAIYEGIIN